MIVDNAVATVQPAADAKGVRVQTIDRSARRAGVGRSRAPAAGRLESGVERGEVHAEERPRAGAPGAGQLARRDRRQRHRHRHPRRISCPMSSSGFVRPTPARRARRAASGSGLAIVRHIVEMHGGTVEASSAGEGKGATFRVRLPLMIVHPRGLDAATRASAHRAARAR